MPKIRIDIGFRPWIKNQKWVNARQKLGLRGIPVYGEFGYEGRGLGYGGQSHGLPFPAR